MASFISKGVRGCKHKHPSEPDISKIKRKSQEINFSQESKGIYPLKKKKHN